MSRARRHPLEVTVDRLRDHYSAYHQHFTGRERDEISHVAYLLEGLAEKERGKVTR
jgi:hypothetical protein